MKIDCSGGWSKDRVGGDFAMIVTVGMLRNWLDSGHIFEGTINTIC